MARFAVLVSLLSLLVAVSSAQTTSVSDPQAVSLAAKSIAAMSGGLAVTDVSLSATVTSIAGSDNESGTGVFLARGITESRVALSLKGGQRTEIRNALSGVPVGSWAGKNGSARISQHNCWTDAAWFAPVLSSLSASDPAIVLKYIGQEKHAGIAVLHLRSSRYVPTQDSNVTALLQKASTMEFYLDPTSTLPFAVSYNTHPDDDLNTDIRTEIRFADYRAVNGIKAPFHIQRLVNDGLALDLSVTGVVVNSGVSDTNFTF
jgi:hypothetical protein